MTGSDIIYPHTQGPFCEVRYARGTSLSSPLVAGHANLVREYFLRGFYPSGQATDSDGFSPSGALLKAMLVSSGSALKRIVYDKNETQSLTQTSFADNNQGYGRVELDDTMAFVNCTLDGLTLFVKGSSDPSSEHYAELAGGDQPHTYTFRTVADTSLRSVRVVLAYTVRTPAMPIHGSLRCVFCRTLTSSVVPQLPWRTTST